MLRMSQENQQEYFDQPSYLVDFHVRMSVMPESKPVSMAADPLWFLNKSAYLPISNQIGQYSRMSQDSAEEGLKKCLEKLPRSGMMRNGILYELPDLEHPIDAKESSLLLTPGTVQIDPSDRRYQRRVEYRKSVNRHWSAGCLAEQISMLPTPTCRDYKGGTVSRVLEGNPKRALDCEMQVHGLKLQPAFVEWMMGFPQEWTALNASEMPLSRSRSTRSSKQSRKLKKESCDQ
jgi:hypothetical protein